MRDFETSHTPAMIKEVLQILQPQEGRFFVDATFGRGGYTKALLDASACYVVALDRDPEAIEFGKTLQDLYKDRLTLIHGRFSALEALLERHCVSFVQGIVFDLGVSSPQLDAAERGFSFQKNGPLDMGMGLNKKTAAEVVNKACEEELADILFEYGGERRSRAVARAIVEARKATPLTTTAQLAAVVRGVVRRDPSGIDPATRTFQALRIDVNEELDELKGALRACEKVLSPGGRLVVVSFHSLEDGMVKDFFRTLSGKRGGDGSRHSLAFHKASSPRPLSFRVMSSSAQRPSLEERRANPRARSARLRWGERTDAPATAEVFWK